eukprot:955642-Amphidinium_carterae.1
MSHARATVRLKVRLLRTDLHPCKKTPQAVSKTETDQNIDWFTASSHHTKPSVSSSKRWTYVSSPYQDGTTGQHLIKQGARARLHHKSYVNLLLDVKCQQHVYACRST